MVNPNHQGKEAGDSTLRLPEDTGDGVHTIYIILQESLLNLVIRVTSWFEEVLRNIHYESRKAADHLNSFSLSDQNWD